MCRGRGSRRKLALVYPTIDSQWNLVFGRIIYIFILNSHAHIGIFTLACYGICAVVRTLRSAEASGDCAFGLSFQILSPLGLVLFKYSVGAFGNSFIEIAHIIIHRIHRTWASDCVVWLGFVLISLAFNP